MTHRHGQVARDGRPDGVQGEHIPLVHVARSVAVRTACGAKLVRTAARANDRSRMTRHTGRHGRRAESGSARRGGTQSGALKAPGSAAQSSGEQDPLRGGRRVVAQWYCQCTAARASARHAPTRMCTGRAAQANSQRLGAPTPATQHRAIFPPIRVSSGASNARAAIRAIESSCIRVYTLHDATFYSLPAGATPFGVWTSPPHTSITGNLMRQAAALGAAACGAAEHLAACGREPAWCQAAPDEIQSVRQAPSEVTRAAMRARARIRIPLQKRITDRGSSEYWNIFDSHHHFRNNILTNPGTYSLHWGSELEF